MIHVTNLTKRFGKLVALDDVSFDIMPGESVALWGANGAGKTTALRSLLGVLSFEGRVEVAGYNVSLHGKEARRQIGFVPQELNFHDDLSVRETMRFYARLKKVPDAPIEDLLARLELAEHVEKQVAELSGGMKQKLALAVALLGDPPILMLDEPTANLDARARDDFLHLLGDLQAGGKTLVFSSHRLEEVFTLADRILVLEAGRLVADCPPAEVSAALGLEARLRLYLPGDMIESAVSLLDTHGYKTVRNGRSVYVRVAEQEKGEPIQVLLREGIPVHNFEVEHANGKLGTMNDE